MPQLHNNPYHPKRLLLLPVLVACTAPALAQLDAEARAEEEVRSVFAASVILTDTETINFGMLSFDPNNLSELSSDDFGDEESVRRRRNMQTYVLPGRWKLSPDEDRLRAHLGAGLTYLSMMHELTGNGAQTAADRRDRARVVGLYAETGLSYRFNDRWDASAGTGLNLNRYDSGVRNTPSEIADALAGGSLQDAGARAMIAELRGRLRYSRSDWGIPWALQTTYSHYRGKTESTGDDIGNLHLQSWSWTHGLTVRWHMSPIFDRANHLRLSTRRIDVGGDIERALGTRQYYQVEMGWLFEFPDRFSWVDNFGASFSLNIGSALSGASIGLAFNEEF